ncbi:hypothetical protein C8Q74DRAFT_1452570, partial [Fomes fomentarius]
WTVPAPDPEKVARKWGFVGLGWVGCGVTALSATRSWKDSAVGASRCQDFKTARQQGLGRLAGLGDVVAVVDRAGPRR